LAPGVADVKEYTIGKNDAGQRLDRFVAKAVPLLPASLAQKYIRTKRIKVGGKGSKREYKLSPGDVVQMYVNDEFFEAPDPDDAYRRMASPALDIVYEDENIILIDKPAGVLCHSDSGSGHGAGRYSGRGQGSGHGASPSSGAGGGASPSSGHGASENSGAGAGQGYDYGAVVSRLQAYLVQKGEWRPREENAFAPALCNRIDRNTSGIVIAAKNAEALRIVNEKIRLREIDKYYLAAVHGAPKPASGRLEGYIFKDAVKNQVYVTKDSRPGSKSAVTEYRTIASKGRLSLLECRLITGRTHQIRAQLAALGAPLLGDGKYGSERLNKPYGESRQALCSYKLVFAFETDAGPLSYLDKSTFKILSVPFVKKYFPGIDI